MRMGTQQPSIARWEAGIGNPRLSTLTQLGIALQATVRVMIEPCELLGREPFHVQWWDRESACAALYSHVQPKATIAVESIAHAPAQLPALSSAADPYLIFETGEIHPLGTVASAAIAALSEQLARDEIAVIDPNVNVALGA